MAAISATMLRLHANTNNFAAALKSAGNTFGKYRAQIWAEFGYTLATAVYVESLRAELGRYPDNRPSMPFSERRRRRLLAPWTLQPQRTRG